MACEPMVVDGKTVGIMCGPRRRRRPCEVTGCPNAQTRLCDFPLAGAKRGKTCSRGICEKHRGQVCGSAGCTWRGTTTGPNCPACGARLDGVEDFCPTHLSPDADLRELLNVPFTFDINRDATRPCVFCRGRDVRLVTLGHYANGTDFTRPVCDPCAAAEATLHRRPA